MPGRRSFLQGLVAAAVTTSLDVFGHVTPKTPPIVTKRLVTMLNPAYLNAEYEMEFFFNARVVQMMAKTDARPLTGPDRFNLVNGKYERVPFFITVEEDED